MREILKLDRKWKTAVLQSRRYDIEIKKIITGKSCIERFHTRHRHWGPYGEKSP